MMKKNDLILAAAVILAACAIFAFQYFSRSGGEQYVEITVDGDLYGTFSLNEDRTVRINETNRLVISGESAVMEWADCPDQICVNHRPVSSGGESIICLPNKVVVSVVGYGEDNLKNRAAYFGVFTALALILSYVETLIPIRFGAPGIKLGLANLIIVIVLYKTDWKEALVLSVTRILLAGFIFGNMFSILYSLAGGVLSLAVMAVFIRSGRFSVTGVSMAGGVAHNIGQLVTAMFAVSTYQVGYYLPVLLIAGLVTGALIGLTADAVLRRIRNLDFRQQTHK